MVLWISSNVVSSYQLSRVASAVLSRPGVLSQDGDVRTVPEHLHLPAGPVTGAPVPAVPVGPLENTLRALPVRQLHVSRHLPVVAVLVQDHQPVAARAAATHSVQSWGFSVWPHLTCPASTTASEASGRSKQSCEGSWLMLLLRQSLKSTKPAWLAVMWEVTRMIWPGLYCLTITPLAYFPPGASWSFTSASQESPQSPHLERSSETMIQTRTSRHTCHHSPPTGGPCRHRNLPSSCSLEDSRWTRRNASLHGMEAPPWSRDLEHSELRISSQQ